MLEIGIYEKLITKRIRDLIDELPKNLTIVSEQIDTGEAHERLARHLYEVLRSQLDDLPGDEKEKLAGQLSLCNSVIDVIQRSTLSTDVVGDLLEAPVTDLQAVHSSAKGDGPPTRPIVPLNSSALIVNEGERINLAASIKRELESADSVDLICAFVNHTGIRILRDEIIGLCKRGTLRLITTTYMGATQRKALDLLHDWGVQIKVSFEVPPSNTRLHAKAWLFNRNTGFHTAYIGSSNISHAALLDGLEWNVRLSETEVPAITAKFRSTFERYWADPSFEAYDPEKDGVRLSKALRASDRSSDEAPLISLDVNPYPHQREILEALEVERVRHNRWRNLVVAATGTGKTVIAALDYLRLRNHWKDASLLFIAHRKEILQQSCGMFRTVLRDRAFGEEWVDGKHPEKYRHVFASIQSLSNCKLEEFKPERFDVVVIDEFHHGLAPTYRRVVEYFRPKVMLGLTATPERTDGTDVRDVFGGDSMVELRLWDALDRGLLCPFQYFGIADSEDLSDVTWRQGKYDLTEIEDRFVNKGADRVALIWKQLRDIVTDISRMRALGFCVSVKHAAYMAKRFSELGVKCACVTGDTDSVERNDAIDALRKGNINIVFAVDIFNEGVDLPELDTVLFLRPTESATVYIQQLGRGLRLHPSKSCLTVLDFIGNQNKKFRFDLRYRAMTGSTRGALEEQVNSEFTSLPAGCYIQLDSITRKHVLDNLKQSLPVNRQQMVNELRAISKAGQPITLETFLYETKLEPVDLYRKDRNFLSLCREAGLRAGKSTALGQRIMAGLPRLLSIDDEERTSYYRDVLTRAAPPALNRLTLKETRKLFMLLFSLMQDIKLPGLERALDQFWQEEEVREEIVQLLQALDVRSTLVTTPISASGLTEVPLRQNGKYTTAEIGAALGMDNPKAMREGVRYFPEHNCDVFFITLRKADRDFSPTTRYRDYPISRDLFHWETQSTTREAHETGQRYIHHQARGSNVLLMVREQKNSGQGAAPYHCLGSAKYVSHESECPMRITWKLDTPMPEVQFQQFCAAAG